MDDSATLEEYLAGLRAQHRVLDEEIAGLTATPGASAIALQKLKKKKLALKDAIARIESSLLPDIIA